jgi:hypothetical protein
MKQFSISTEATEGIPYSHIEICKFKAQQISHTSNPYYKVEHVSLKIIFQMVFVSITTSKLPQVNLLVSHVSCINLKHSHVRWHTKGEKTTYASSKDKTYKKFCQNINMHR